MKVLKPTTIPFPNNGRFIRNSTATYIEDGILKTAAINEPRWQDGKLLLEDASTNLMPWSQNLNNWTVYNVSVSVSPEKYLGFADFYNISKTTTATSAPLSLGVSLGPESGYIFASIVLLAGTSTTCNVGLYNSGWADAITTVVSGPGVVTSDTPWGPGLPIISNLSPTIPTVVKMKILLSFPENGSGFYIYPGTADSTTVGHSVKATAVQIEKNGFSSYIPTSGTQVKRAADVCVGNFLRDSIGTYIDDNGVLQTAAINVPRIQNDRLLIENSATNYCLNNNTSTPEPYNAGDSFGTITVLSDPFWGNVLRITKTNGTPGGINRVGARWILAAMQETVTVSIWIRRGSNSTGYAVYSDLNRIGGGFTSPTKRMADAPVGVWTKVSATASSPVGHSGGYLYTWIDSNVGDYIDIALPCAFNGSLDSSAFITTGTPNTRAPDIHSAGLVYTNATDVRPLWSSATTYSVGQIIRYNNTVYESLQNTNLNHPPDISPTWWLSLGADNISAAFDGKVGSKTTAVDKLRMIVYPGSTVDAVGYLETNASVVNTSVLDVNRNLAYSNSTGFTEANIENWYDYFFVSPLADPATQVVHQGIPSLDPGLFIGIEMINPGTVEVGSVLTGYSTTIGKTQYGLKAGIVDYSKKESDEFGNVSIVERPYSKRMQGDVYVQNYDLNKVQRFLYSIRATPVLWMASDNPELAEVSYVYGFYKDFSTTISYPDVSMCNLDIEGLV